MWGGTHQIWIMSDSRWIVEHPAETRKWMHVHSEPLCKGWRRYESLWFVWERVLRRTWSNNNNRARIALTFLVLRSCLFISLLYFFVFLDDFVFLFFSVIASKIIMSASEFQSLRNMKWSKTNRLFTWKNLFPFLSSRKKKQEKEKIKNESI